MSVINSQPLIGASGNQSTAYNLTRSLRFRSSASAYLNRTPASAGNRRTATFSFWIKRGSVATDQAVYSLGTFPTNLFEIIFGADNTFAVQNTPNSTTRDLFLATTQVFRDPSAWYHIVISIDTTQATASNRAKMYVNGSQITAFSTATYPNQNTDLNLGLSAATQIGRRADGNYYQDAYFSEFHHIDGQALDASSFGETDTATGVWKPKKYTGTYGTNGFYLKFDNITSTSTLGNDSSGNSNTWTVNNISLTSGATYDSMKDVPTLTDADTANYAVLNPLDVLSDPSTRTITNGNLNASLTNSWNGGATMAVSSGSWYCEATLTSNFDFYIGIDNGFASVATAYRKDGTRFNGSSFVSYGATYTTNDVIGMAFDVTNSTVTYYKNNVSQGQVTGVTYGSIARPFFYGVNGTTFNVNFGQRPFAYTPPSGFKALNTFNLPTPTIGATASTQANKYFDAVTYTGTGSSRNVTGYNFSPDFVWVKARNTGEWHILGDIVRGTGKSLFTNRTDAEFSDGYTSFNSDGFGVNSWAGTNGSGNTYVAWAWDANGAGSSNTAGTITSTVSANTSAGFSIATYTGNGTNGATVGHGLGVSPGMIIVKRRDTTSFWMVAHSGLSSGNNLILNLTNAQSAATGFTDGGIGSYSSTTFTCTQGTSSSANINANNGTYVAYCFAEVAGYSRFGSYTGNGSTDGPFVFTGFRPKFVMVKSFAGVTLDWAIKDTSRDTFNVASNTLLANLSSAEIANNGPIDILSNGFKIRSTNDNYNNGSGSYIYMAFAENPFKYSLAR